jgi:hypothetical protein
VVFALNAHIAHDCLIAGARKEKLCIQSDVNLDFGSGFTDSLNEKAVLCLCCNYEVWINISAVIFTYSSDIAGL